MVAGGAADRFGRKPLLMVSAVLFTVSAVATGWADDFTLFNIARFIGGIGIGVASALAPMYIAEVSPANIRGRMVSLNQMTIVIGILAAQIVNMLLARDTMSPDTQAWNVGWGWRWMFWAETPPAALFLVMSFFIPESPVYVKMKAAPMPVGKKAEAGLGELFQPKYRKVLLLGLVIAVFQQWCGTNVIFNYAQEIFVSAGYDGYSQRDIYLRGAIYNREMGAPHADVDRCRRTGTDISYTGRLLSCRSYRLHHGGTRGVGDIGVCHDSRSCHMDPAGRDIP